MNTVERTVGGLSSSSSSAGVSGRLPSALLILDHIVVAVEGDGWMRCTVVCRLCYWGDRLGSRGLDGDYIEGEARDDINVENNREPGANWRLCSLSPLRVKHVTAYGSICLVANSV